ncbi:hypothetical protein PR202_ga06359 [Eleusine coracana subsp. coracana]|uniref:DM2 domain-containing protein n=1 Tax=Eleusine coracana subsp. coracana TaxID=191504 RepID=A0AAV5BWP0_ELECO|nr:hypothetical protein QOZ80_2AG0100570 [Eleusine coracana subsp. coracana]GJM90110.1 hypothetical protein PR202_ga06359 [Eleusine coracana subsp. coracana]
MAALARAFRGCRFLMSPAAPAAGGTRRPVAAAAGATKAAKAGATKPKAAGGITIPLPVSDALSKFVGADQVSRSGAIKLIWAHIKAKGLQNPADKREIICDEELKTIFGNRDKVGMMEIAKLIGPHFIKK